MASGHVNRTNRPNTWLHRPACKREENPCQLGAVHTWHSGNERMRPLGPLGRICPSGRRPDVAIIGSGAYRSHGDRSNGVRGDD